MSTDNNSVPFQPHSLSTKDVEISLAKPNKQTIGRLREAFGIRQSLKLGQLNEISFSIPYEIDINNVLSENKHVESLRHRYLLNVKSLNSSEWYTIVSTSDSLNDSNIKQVTAYGLGYQLSDKYIREWAGVEVGGEFQKESLSAVQVLEDLLSETGWSIGVVDSLLKNRYRAFEFANTTVLDAVFNVAESFNATVDWDTKNKRVNLYDADKYGKFDGLRLSENRYLKSYERQTEASDMATRLRVYGKDGISISEVNPTGMEYIDDYSYLMSGFVADEQGNVISSSPYLSDDLCLALIAYQRLTESKDGQFKALIAQKEPIESRLVEKENELLALNNELIIIQDAIDLRQSKGMSALEELAAELSKKTAIKLKEIEISEVIKEVSLIDASITALKNEISMEANFTETQLSDLNEQTVVKVWENENISDPEELFDLGRKEMNKINRPSTIYNIGLVYLLKVANAEKDVARLKLGDRIRISKKEIDGIIESQIIGIDIDYDNNDISLTIGDSHKLGTDEDRLMQKIDRSISTSAIVNSKKKSWNDIEKIGAQVHAVLTSKWESGKNEIIAGVNESVVINNRGITVADTERADKYLRITHGVIGMFKDNDEMRLAITPDGVYAEELIGRIIAGENLYMENEDGKFIFNKDGVSIQADSFRIVSSTGSNLVDNWNNAEEAAKEYANGIRQQISGEIADIHSALEDLEIDITASFRDGIISEAEAISIASYLKFLESEKVDLDRRYQVIYADTLLTGNAKSNLNVAKTEYDTSYSILISTINTAISDRKTTTEEKTDVDNKFTAHRLNLASLTERLENAIDFIANAKVSNAQAEAKTYADNLKKTTDKEILDINNAIGDLEEEITTSFKDGVISEAEAIAIEKHKNLLTNEKADLDSRYTVIYNDPLLIGAAKTELKTAKDAYNTAHTNLLTSINTAIADKKTTEAEKKDVDAKFVLYKNSISSLSDKFEKAINFLSQKKADNAKDSANSFTQEKVNAINLDIGDVRSKVTGLQSFVDDAFSDGFIDSAERETLRGYIQQLNNEKADIDARYNAIHADANLLGTAKTNLSTAKTHSTTGFDVAHNALITAINNAIADNLISDAERTAVNNAFTTYRTRLTTLSTRFEEAIRAIENKKAETAENNSKAYADDLKRNVEAQIGVVATSVTNLNTVINSTFKDGVISEAEAKSIATYINVINTEKADLDSRYTVIFNDASLIGTPKTNLSTAKTAYDSAHSALISSINTAIADKKTTPDEAQDVNTKFGLYRTSLGTLSTRFGEATKSIEQVMATKAVEDAKTYTDGQVSLVLTEIEDVDDKLDGLKNFTDGAFSDGVISIAERETFSGYIRQLNNEKADVDAKYTSIYGDTNLSGTAKTNLLNAKTHSTTGFDKAHTDLITAINNAIADGKITSAERTTVDNAFTTYRTRLTTLATRLEEAVRAIETAKADKAKQDANSYTDGVKTTLESSIEVNTRDIGLRVKQEDYTTDMRGVVTRFENTEASIKLTKDDVALKADKTDVYNKTEADGKIDSKIKVAEAGFLVEAEKISQRVARTEITTSGTINELKSKVSTAEATIINQGNLIETKVNTADIGNLIAEKNNLINNPAITGNITGWTASAATLSVVKQDFFGTSMNVIQSNSSGNSQNYSPYFNVDPSKAYEVSIWVKSAQPVPSGTHFYLGVSSLGSTSVEPISVATGVKSADSSNFYFWSVTGSSNNLSDWHKVTGYILPAGFEPSKAKGLGESVTSNLRMKPSHTQMRIRFLNYSNTSARNMWVANPSVREVPAELLGNLNNKIISAESSISQFAGEIDAKVSKTDYTGQTIIGLMNLTPEQFKVQAKNISLNGAVVIENGLTKISNASITNAHIVNLDGGKITANTIDASAIKAGLLTGFTIQTDASLSNPRIVMSRDKMTFSSGKGNEIVINTSGTYLSMPEIEFKKAGESLTFGRIGLYDNDMYINQGGNGLAYGRLKLWGQEAILLERPTRMHYNNGTFGVPSETGMFYFDGNLNTMRIYCGSNHGWRSVALL